MRGEQFRSRPSSRAFPGSPPLARGTASCRRAPDIRSRITPACAGNSSDLRACTPQDWDHPRLRGEQYRYAQSMRYSAGSPPLARGTDISSATFNGESRITPACAGNRNYPDNQRRNEGDHPRLRGEQLGDALNDIGGKGSPPLARGTGPCKTSRPTRRRITPACAGNRYTRRLQSRHAGDHPRLRGEQSIIIHSRHGVNGSPPLARGTVYIS